MQPGPTAYVPSAALKPTTGEENTLYYISSQICLECGKNTHLKFITQVQR
jgi:hypothetical protein